MSMQVSDILKDRNVRGHISCCAACFVSRRGRFRVQADNSKSILEFQNHSLGQHANSDSRAIGTIGTLLQLGGTRGDRHCDGMILKSGVLDGVHGAN